MLLYNPVFSLQTCSIFPSLAFPLFCIRLDAGVTFNISHSLVNLDTFLLLRLYQPINRSTCLQQLPITTPTSPPPLQHPAPHSSTPTCPSSAVSVPVTLSGVHTPQMQWLSATRSSKHTILAHSGSQRHNLRLTTRITSQPAQDSPDILPFRPCWTCWSNSHNHLHNRRHSRSGFGNGSGLSWR